jgi:hypothetical protein
MLHFAKVNKVFSFYYNEETIYCIHRTGHNDYKYTMISSSKYPSWYIHMENHLQQEDIVSSSSEAWFALTDRKGMVE